MPKTRRGLPFPDARASCRSRDSHGQAAGRLGPGLAGAPQLSVTPGAAGRLGPWKARHGARGRRGDASPGVRLGHLRGPEEDEQAPGKGGPRGGRAGSENGLRRRGVGAFWAGLRQGQRLGLTAPPGSSTGSQRPWVQICANPRVGTGVRCLALTRAQ